MSIARDEVFRALSDPHRRRMLELLGAGERGATDLVDSFRMTQSAVSQHLRVLREASLVRVRRAGRARFYRVDPGALRAVADWAARIARRGQP